MTGGGDEAAMGDRATTRRALLRAGLGAGLAGTLAGCSGGGDTTATSTADTGDDPTTTGTGAGGDTATATETTRTERATSERPAASIPADTAVWLHPSPFSDVLPQLAGNPDEWDRARERVDGVEWHAFGQEWAHPFDSEYADDFCALLGGDDGPMVGGEVWGPGWHVTPYDDGIGERAAARRIEYLSTVADAGCPMDRVNVDGPFKRQLAGTRPEVGEHGFDSYERAATQTVDFVVALREEFSGIRPWIIVNFPHWRWKGSPSVTGADYGDYHEAFGVLVDAFEARGVPLEGVMVDHPYDYPGQERLLELRDVAHDRGVGFNMIVNSERGGESSDHDFANLTLWYLARLQSLGLDPDRYTVESWYPYPKRNVPESDPDTMAGLTKRILDARGRG